MPKLTTASNRKNCNARKRGGVGSVFD